MLHLGVEDMIAMRAQNARGVDLGLLGAALSSLERPLASATLPPTSRPPGAIPDQHGEEHPGRRRDARQEFEPGLP